MTTNPIVKDRFQCTICKQILTEKDFFYCRRKEHVYKKSECKSCTRKRAHAKAAGLRFVPDLKPVKIVSKASKEYYRKYYEENKLKYKGYFQKFMERNPNYYVDRNKKRKDINDQYRAYNTPLDV